MEKILGIISYKPNVLMSAEICIWMLLLLIIYKTAVENKKFRMVFGGFFLFIAYIHRILLPFIISGAYFFAITGIICMIGRFSIRSITEPFGYVKKSFMYCTDREHRSRAEIFLFYVFIIIVLIQLSRINIAMDYDSLRYGLRSEYVLTGGEGIRGFFESLGFVNMVYSYPKGYELLTLPLNFGHTYGYILCLNIWIFATLCLTAGMTARELTGSSRAGIAAAALTALIPGISNMAVTAKTDLITALLQLIFIYSVIVYIKSENDDYVGIGLSAIILSYTMKPTAYIFSTVIGLFGLFFLLKNKKKIRFNAFGLRLTAIAFIYFGIITVRTLIVSGLPVAGVFTEIFETLGFKLKYPLASLGMPKGGTEGFLLNFLNAALRVVLFLFAPFGADMDHVRMAWGGVVFAVMLITVLYMGKDCRKSFCQKTEAAYVFGTFYVIAALSLLTFFLLYQIDGNYYMLLYLMTSITAATFFYKIRTADRSFKTERYLFGLAAVFMIFITAFSGWAGAVGFTPVELKNRGYYNHEVEYGWKNPLNLKMSDRVVAFAEEPDCYKIRAGVESFVDIDGSGGNVLLTDTKLNIFKEYCSFADIDYIYVDIDWLNDITNQRHVRAKTLFTYMLEDGDFSDIFVTSEDANEVYFKVDKNRMAVPWETEMSESLKERIAKQSEIFKELIK